jgi:hypothetical protein
MQSVFQSKLARGTSKSSAEGEDCRSAAPGASSACEKQRSHRQAELEWKPEDKPAWLDETVYATQVRPKLANRSISTIALALGVSLPYASDIRAGRRRPHPRHWLALAKLVGIPGIG